MWKHTNINGRHNLMRGVERKRGERERGGGRKGGRGEREKMLFLSIKHTRLTS